MITRDRRTFETLYQQQCMASDSWIKFLQQLPHSDFAKTKLNKFINVKFPQTRNPDAVDKTILGLLTDLELVQIICNGTALDEKISPSVLGKAHSVIYLEPRFGCEQYQT